MAATRETLIEWLKDAHAMEQQAINMLEKQADRIEQYPGLREKVRDHLEQTRHQASRVEGCIQKLGGDTSAIKEGVAKFMGSAANLVNQSAGDEVVKNGIADYAFEHFEIASYRALIGAADKLGEEEIRKTCEEILEEEEAMASWLETNLPDVTQQYLQRERTEHSADR